MKHTIALLLLISMLLVPLVACSGDSDSDNQGTTTTTAASTTADPNAITTYLEPLSEELKALDFDGEQVVMLGRTDDSTEWMNDIFVVEELMNEPINDAIYNRNLAVSEMLNVEFVQNKDGGSVNDLVSKMVNSGESTYDIVAGSVYYSTPMMRSGYLYNMYDNGIDKYLNTESQWWPQYWIEEAEIEERLYFLAGTPTLSLTRAMFVTYFNKNMAESYGIENLYDVVTRGDWTMDYMSSLVSGIYRDLNGNDQRDIEDEYGMASNLFENADVYWSSFDMEMLTKDSDGWFELSGEKEKISKAFEKVYDLLYNNTGVYSYDSMEENWIRQLNMFANGNVLLTPLHLYYAETQELRNMQDEYGIIPTPKYDKDQKEYYTFAHDQYSVFMIPCTVKDPEMSGAVLEALAYESYKSVQPIYYDIVLKGRYANDPESREMLDTITGNIKVNCAWIYANILDDPAADVFRSLINDKKTTFASAYATVETKLPKTLKTLEKTISLFDY